MFLVLTVQRMSELGNVDMYMCHREAVLFTRSSIAVCCYAWEQGIHLIEFLPLRMLLIPLLVEILFMSAKSFSSHQSTFMFSASRSPWMVVRRSLEALGSNFLQPAAAGLDKLHMRRHFFDSFDITRLML